MTYRITRSAAATVAVGQADDENDTDSPRSGALQITKECSQYTRLPGSFCTITSSNLKQIPVGTRVIYASAAGTNALGHLSLDTDVTLDPPGPGNNAAFGHVVLDLVTASGVVTLSGGTGKFRGISGRADISHLTGRNWAWNGTYSFANEGGDD